MIPSSPNPTPSGSVETQRRQDPGTNLFGTGKNLSFFRLLSSELNQARNETPESGDGQRGLSAREKQSSEEERTRADLINRELKNSPTPGQRSDSTDAGFENIARPEQQEAGWPGGTAVSWGSFASLTQLGQPLSMAATSVTGIAPFTGAPADMMAPLASFIAEAYSEKNGIQTLTMTLEPDHLGRVEVRLQARGDQLSIRLMTASPEAESAMRENLKDLTEAIQTRTGRYQQVEVRVELKESQEPDQDPADEDPRNFQGQNSPEDQGQGNDSEDPANRTSDHQVETEPEFPGQGG